MNAAHLIMIVSALGGVIGGMGMGGGTLLIPLLTLGGIEQHLAQAINLMAFVPMSLTALLIHKKNGYVDVKNSWRIAAIALIGAVGGSVLSAYVGGQKLRVFYGVFLIALGAFQLVKTVLSALKTRKTQKSAA